MASAPSLQHQTTTPPRPTAASAAPIPASPSPDDLLIVGPGVLGAYLGVLWKAAHPGAAVVAQTNTPARHAAVTRAGPDTRNIGAAINGRRRRLSSEAGNDMAGDYLSAGWREA